GDGDDAGAGAVVEAELGGGAHHALGDLAVGLAGGDLEWARQHGARQGDDHVVALGEIAGTTDDVLRLAGAVGLADGDLTVADRLLEALQLLDVAHLADDEWTLGLREALVALRLEADADETCVEFFGVHRPAGVRGLQDPGEPVLRNQHVLEKVLLPEELW